MAVVTACGSTPTGSTCDLSGNWSVSHTAQGGTTITVALQSAGQKTTFDRTGGSLPTVHVDGTYAYDSAAGQITFTNTSVTTTDPNFDACINVPGKYNVVFSDCSHFTLQLVSDTCSVRVQSIGSGSAVITKQ